MRERPTRRLWWPRSRPAPGIRATPSSRTPPACRRRSSVSDARHCPRRDPHAWLHHSAGVRLPGRPPGPERLRGAERRGDQARRGRAGRRDRRCGRAGRRVHHRSGAVRGPRSRGASSAKRSAWRWSMRGRGPMPRPPAPGDRSIGSSGSTIRASRRRARRCRWRWRRRAGDQQVSTPVEPGEIEIRAQVTLTVAIK